MLAFRLLILVQLQPIEGLHPVLDLGLEHDSHPQPPVCSSTYLIVCRCSNDLVHLSEFLFRGAPPRGQRGDLDLSQSIVEDPMDCINHLCAILEKFA